MAIYVCHCSECRHQSSSAFGVTAIFPTFTIDPPHEVAIGIYSRQTLSGRKLDCYFCTRCGSRLMHKCNEDETLSVKAGCLDEFDLKGAVHIWCKEAIMEIPSGVERYQEEPRGGSL
ncbi:hypothetical protein MMC22_000308 [Lobaria immixta]|nr:hypothetical protein [Lobaria immixta]